MRTRKLVGAIILLGLLVCWLFLWARASAGRVRLQQWVRAGRLLYRCGIGLARNRHAAGEMDGSAHRAS